MSRLRLWLLAGWAAILGLVGSIYLGPYIAAWRIRRAVAARDAAALESLVDFPAVRENLKGELRRRVGAEQRARRRERGDPVSPEETPARDLRSRLVVAVGEAMIERFATPEGVEKALSEGEPEATGWASFLDSEALASGSGGTAEDIFIEAGYQGWSDFRVRVTVPSDGSSAEALWADILFERRGIWSWQVTGARLSPDMLPLPGS